MGLTMATPKLVSPTGKPIALRPVLTNSGIHAAYRKRLTALVQEMHDSLIYWLSAAYKSADAPAMDDGAFIGRAARLPARVMREAMARMVVQWNRNFDDGAQKLAKWFAQKQKSYADVALKTILKDAGFSVAFTVTPAMQNTLDAVIGENVALIKSIGSQHLTQVEGLVMRATQAGRDLGPLAKQLEAQFGVTKRRAAFIARDQANKSTASINSTRQQELGITQGKWRHSGAGAEPRPEHVAANGKLFDLSKGMLLEGEWVLPGQAINCRCSWAPVIPGFID
jgi:SPP1 gp7 family putative phage head morphogenesis protein